MKNVLSILIFLVLIGCNKSSSEREKDYIKNLEEKNRALEKELQSKENSYKNGESGKISNEFFKIGSTEDEVLQVMGDPSSLDNVGPFKIFHYESSSVKFENGRVRDYDNFDGNLKVKVK